MSVVTNASKLALVLKKKSNSIAYHYVREGVSMDEWRTAYVNTEDNPGDIFSKAVSAGKGRDRKVRMFMWDI